ncbi:DUF1996 domain-containing protein [Streptomyces mirabilis]|uniref:DUF1996 domain-containing protein n=1 Tax=Streptomyces mirabilis TaxID=68239 RepID=UPI0021BF452C|nr:DUF1996 domain-containing protein [Streptomyces mirabilis]MCT9111569.1 DUF1996 domain-containing protein [Streptomyces mirabilis]
MGAQRATFAAAALILGGGGLVAVNVYASATESGSAGQTNPNNQTWASGAATIDCPDVGSKLAEVPQQARAEVDKELALLDQQVSEAYARMTSEQQAKAQDADFLQNAILGPLKEKRGAVIDRIKTDFKNAGAEAPNSIDDLATCTAVPADQTQNNAGGQNGDGQQQNNNGGQQGGQQGGGQQGAGAVSGPVAADFVDITTLQPNVPQKPGSGDNASTGTFTSSCGVNANKKFNTDNVIVAPGVTNGAHHLHDYVGNQSNDAFATNDDLANAETTCQNQGDKSTYYWPVLRVQDGTQEFDADKNGGGLEGNVGKVLQAKQAQIEFIGNPQSKVAEMPTFLRIITGDAKAFTNGPANANAHWSCTGFEDKVQLTDKYPICPQGSSVVRSFAFQSCWDGQNIDSANHRTHVAFADANGNCAGGFKAIPQLTMRLIYDVPAPTLENGQVKNPYAVDGFPEQVHKAITDHDDFINVFDASLMREMVDCINAGRQCGDGAGGGAGGGDGGNDGAGGGGGGAGTGEPSQDEPSPSPDASSGGDDATASATPTDTQTTQPPASTPGTTEPTRGGQTNGNGTGDTVVVPKADTSPSAAASDTAAAPQGGAPEHQGSEATHRPQTPAAGADAPSTQATAQETSQAGSQSQSQTEPQAVTGDLADTGTNLWPAAAGGVLVIAGLVLLRRIRRGSV